MSDMRFCARPRGFLQDHIATLEPLESRLLMSGDVSAQVVQGSLVIRGDISSNHIVIDQAGLAAGQFRITGQDGTKVNGQNLRIVSGVTKDVRVGLGDGVDVLEMAGVAVTRDLTIRGGHSGDTFSLTGGSVGRNVSVNVGEGDNTVVVDGTIIGGRLNVSGGRGVDVLNVANSASVAGKVSFQPGRGESTCDISQATLGSLTLNGRGGPATVQVAQSSIQGRTAIVSSNWADTILLDHCVFGGSLRIDALSGADQIAINSSTCNDATMINAGSGSDDVDIDNQSPGSPGSVFAGFTRVQLGTGNDRIFVNPLDESDPVVFAKYLIDGGAGYDRYYIGLTTPWTGGQYQRLVSILDGPIADSGAVVNIFQ